MKAWRLANPNGKKIECERELGLSRHTVLNGGIINFELEILDKQFETNWCTKISSEQPRAVAKKDTNYSVLFSMFCSFFK